MTGAHWLILAAVVGVALLGWVLWQRRHPRITPTQIREVACEHMAMTVTPAESRKVWRCRHGCVMTEGYIAYDRDVNHALEVVAERDQAKAEHTDRAMRRLTEADLYGTCITHPTAEGAADCVTCSPSSLPRHADRAMRRLEGGDEHG